MKCCPLTGSNDADAPACSMSATRKARKAHRCIECRDAIAIGQRYEHASGVWDGRPSSFKTCGLCVEIRMHFQCDGWVYGQLWADLEEGYFPSMRAGGPCMEGLSPAAKGRLFERRLAWLLR